MSTELEVAGWWPVLVDLGTSRRNSRQLVPLPDQPVQTWCLGAESWAAGREMREDQWGGGWLDGPVGSIMAWVEAAMVVAAYGGQSRAGTATCMGEERGCHASP